MMAISKNFRIIAMVFLMTIILVLSHVSTANANDAAPPPNLGRKGVTVDEDYYNYGGYASFPGGGGYTPTNPGSGGYTPTNPGSGGYYRPSHP